LALRCRKSALSPLYGTVRRKLVEAGRARN
jgi:hypothetical protein